LQTLSAHVVFCVIKRQKGAKPKTPTGPNPALALTDWYEYILDKTSMTCFAQENVGYDYRN